MIDVRWIALDAGWDSEGDKVNCDRCKVNCDRCKVNCDRCKVNRDRRNVDCIQGGFTTFI